MGQSDMFRLLYRLYAPNCWRVAQGIVKNETLTEDAVQNAFIRAFQNLDKFEHKSSFKTWLIRIVINESLKVLKANKRYLYLEHDEDILEEQSPFQLSDELLLSEKNERQQIVQSAMTQLAEVWQLLLNLFYLEELSIKEIAIATDFSEAKIKTGLHRARKELKVILDKKYNFA